VARLGLGRAETAIEVSITASYTAHALCELDPRCRGSHLH
jgi:hypothetical protein